VNKPQARFAFDRRSVVVRSTAVRVLTHSLPNQKWTRQTVRCDIAAFNAHDVAKFVADRYTTASLYARRHASVGGNELIFLVNCSETAASSTRRNYLDRRLIQREHCGRQLYAIPYVCQHGRA